MMNNSQASRRSFLSSLAILSAGAAFGSVTDLFTADRQAADLQQLWRFFCNQNGGQLPAGPVSLKDETDILPCKGHIHKAGKEVFFEKENLLARPTWIYWGQEKGKPADVIITFFRNDKEQTKLFRINRFELEALCGLSDRNPDNKLLTTLEETKLSQPKRDQSGKTLVIKTRIRNGKEAQILTAYSQKQLLIEKTFTYNA